MEAHFVFENVSFRYPSYDSSTTPLALDNVSLQLPAGKFIAVVGANGSGKSTFLRHLNGLLQADSGNVRVGGLDPASEKDLREVRRRYGMVFQNPENQIVGTTVEEDIAFGLENLGVERREMESRITAVLKELDMSDLRTRSVAELSGGQKQKLAIASVLVMEPRGFLLDEVTAMLDPQSRANLLDLIRQLMKERELSVFHVTHHMDELMQADYCLLFDQGKLVFQGLPMELFASKAFQTASLELPLELQLLDRLSHLIGKPLAFDQEWDSLYDTLAQSLIQAKDHKVDISSTPEKLTLPITPVPDHDVKLKLNTSRNEQIDLVENLIPIDTQKPFNSPTDQNQPQLVLEAHNLSHRYLEERPDSIHNLTFNVREGEVFAIVGPSGAGKSTLVMHFNGLLEKQAGELRILDINVGERRALNELRKYVQLLFQYPEHQLFASSIREDIAFGPKQLGLSQTEIEERVLKAAEQVGVSYEDLERSPFELSGGQKRRVALAGILAMRPRILILDEPAAGLDADGKKSLFEDLTELKQEGVTIILVSHDMDDVASFADRILVLQEGRLQALGDAADIYSQQDILQKAKLRVPTIYRSMLELARRIPGLDPLAFRLDEAEANVRTYLGENLS